MVIREKHALELRGVRCSATRLAIQFEKARLAKRGNECIVHRQRAHHRGAHTRAASVCRAPHFCRRGVRDT
eukprot:4859411-Lingulodinium_polyedra.AAC.1